MYERETGVRKKGERQGWEREKDKKSFRVGERKIGRETGMVQREREKNRRERERMGDRDGREKGER